MCKKLNYEYVIFKGSLIIKKASKHYKNKTIIALEMLKEELLRRLKNNNKTLL